MEEVVISLNQHSIMEPKVIGFTSYSLPKACMDSTDKEFFKKNKSLVNSQYTNSRQVITIKIRVKSIGYIGNGVDSLARHFKHKKKKKTRIRLRLKRNELKILKIFSHTENNNAFVSFSLQVSHRCFLDQGGYLIIPTTFEPGQESGFTLRVYSSKPLKLK